MYYFQTARPNTKGPSLFGRAEFIAEPSKYYSTKYIMYNQAKFQISS